MDYRSEMFAARRIGEEKGQERGITIGQEREARKAREEKLEIARRLSGMGLNSKQIQDALGLPPDSLGTALPE
jgi:predicted transposase YdaD